MNKTSVKEPMINRPWLWVAIVGVLVLCLVWVGLGVVMFLLGPHDYDFWTSAVYEAPRSGFRIEIEGSGVVRSGHDLSEEATGSAIISPTGRSDARPIVLTLSGFERADYTLEGGQGGVVSRRWRDGPEALARLLRRAGYGTVADEEVRETHGVINGVLSGPKGTTMEGQSEALRVVSVDFHH